MAKRTKLRILSYNANCIASYLLALQERLHSLNIDITLNLIDIALQPGFIGGTLDIDRKSVV